MNNQDYSLKDILSSLAKFRKYIIYTTIGAALLAIIISLLLPVYYKSKTSFYAASPDLGLPNIVGTSDLDRDVYGNDFDIDRLLALSESEMVYSYLIDNFKLYEHYDIDPTDKKAPYMVREELKDLYKVLKTKLGAIELTVEDRDPIFSSNMANGARNQINLLSQGLMKSSQERTLESYKSNLGLQDQALKMLSDSIQFYRQKYNIVDTESQGEKYSELIATASTKAETSKTLLKYFSEIGKRDSLRKYKILANTSERRLSALEGQLKLFTTGATKVEQLVIEFERMINQIAIDRQRDKLLQSAYSNEFSALHVVEVASPPVIKSRPQRALIVIGCTFLAFLLSSAFVLLRANLKDIDFKEIWNG